MRKTKATDLHAGKTLRWAGATPLRTAFSRPKICGVAPARPEQLGAMFLPACRGRRMQVVMQDVRQNQRGKGEGNYGNHQGTTQTTKVGDGSGSRRRVGERT